MVFQRAVICKSYVPTKGNHGIICFLLCSNSNHVGYTFTLEHHNIFNKLFLKQLIVRITSTMLSLEFPSKWCCISLDLTRSCGTEHGHQRHEVMCLGMAPSMCLVPREWRRSMTSVRSSFVVGYFLHMTPSSANSSSLSGGITSFRRAATEHAGLSRESKLARDNVI